MKLIVFEDAHYPNLLPLVYTRPVFKLRCGFSALLYKIEAILGKTADATVVRDAIRDAFHLRGERPVVGVNADLSDDDQLWINGRALVTRPFEIPAGCCVWRGNALLAARVDSRTGQTLAGAVLEGTDALRAVLKESSTGTIADDAARLIDYLWHLVHATAAEIDREFANITPRRAGDVSTGAHLLNERVIHIGEGARVMPGVVLDAENGPIYVGDHVTIRPNAVVTGPCYIGDHCTIQTGANIREGTSLGMWSKIGGEVEASIVHGYSNKQHDGFLGHSYVGEWVNLGADTVTSDLKNTYGNVKVPVNGREVDSGEMFVGATIGDHTKTGINVALPTGCVIGFASNVFVSRYPPKFVPSFSWLTDEGLARYEPERALDVARKVVARRGRELNEAESALFLSVAEMSPGFEQR